MALYRTPPEHSEIVSLSFAGPVERREAAIKALELLGFIELGAMMGFSPAFAAAQEEQREGAPAEAGD